MARRVPSGADPRCDAAKALAQSFKPSANNMRRPIVHQKPRVCPVTAAVVMALMPQP